MQKCPLISQVEKWYPHVEELLHIRISSLSATSESVSIAEESVEGNEESKIKSIFIGSKHLKPLIFLRNFYILFSNYVCIKFSVTVNHINFN